MAETRWRCRECNWITAESGLPRAPHPFITGRTVEGCPHCFEIGDFDRICDEPGCDGIQSIGMPTPTGYRMTCHRHAPEEVDRG